MQDAVTKILATIIGAMGQAAYGCAPVSAPTPMMGTDGVSQQPVAAMHTGQEKEEVVEPPENRLDLSDKLLDDSAVASLFAMFGDED